MDKESKEVIRASLLNSIVSIEKAMWNLLHKLHNKEYNWRQDQLIDIIKAGEYAKGIKDIQSALNNI